MRLYFILSIAALMLVTALASHASKPIEPPLIIDAQSPGVWPRYAAVQPASAIVCNPVLVPDAARRFKGVQRT